MSDINFNCNFELTRIVFKMLGLPFEGEDIVAWTLTAKVDHAPTIHIEKLASLANPEPVEQTFDIELKKGLVPTLGDLWRSVGPPCAHTRISQVIPADDDVHDNCISNHLKAKARHADIWRKTQSVVEGFLAPSELTLQEAVAIIEASTSVCQDCNGTGKLVGLNSVEPCHCQGTK